MRESHSTRRRRKAVVVENRELIHGRLHAGGAHPRRGDIAQRQPDQFRGGLVGREMAARFDDLAHPRVDALERIGRVDHAPNLGRKREERNHLGPGAAPGRDDGRKVRAPRALLEGVERRLAASAVGAV